MTDEPVPEDLATVATRLTEVAVAWRAEAQELRSDLNQQGRFGRNNRRWIYGLIFSLMIDVILSVSVLALAVTASNNSSETKRNRDSQIATCRATNQSRVDNKQLWEFFIQLLVPDETKVDAKTKTALVRLHAKLDSTYTLRDCDNIGSGAPSPITPTSTPS
jgi:hypothetical protein